ncbi:hypothetical protein M9H77_27177 [Catharanthus roseus]|uniref:Uncharacterized protein n=1 Tax=Catharanthus roseus TaxID=4058 RepID=A0ACC0ACN4_CATRO|nr:hypothetical protein M9H77_27177 [Catharanthus roseus]
MKPEIFQEFPRCCINKRWTQNAKPVSKWCQSDQLPKDKIKIARCGVLNAMPNRMNFFAGKTDEGFEEARVLLTQYTSHFRSLWESEDRSCKVMDKPGNENRVEKEPTFDILDPKVSTIKGHNSHNVDNKRKPRQCKCYRSFKHDSCKGPKLTS